jgi:hypothetical protein
MSGICSAVERSFAMPLFNIRPFIIAWFYPVAMGRM